MGVFPPNVAYPLAERPWRGERTQTLLLTVLFVLFLLLAALSLTRGSALLISDHPSNLVVLAPQLLPPDFISNQSRSDATPRTTNNATENIWLGSFCDANNRETRERYLQPHFILQNGAPCLPPTQLEGFAEEAEYAQLEYLKDLLAKGRKKADAAHNNETFARTFSCHGQNLRIVTAADPHYFINLINLIGSVHFWEPDLKITVYSMNLAKSQIERLMKLKNVLVRRLPLEILPPHFSVFHTYAFKPFLFLDALRSHSEYCFLWQDAGQELRRPITSIRRILEIKGHFLVKSGLEHPSAFTHPKHLAFFGMNARMYSEMSLGQSKTRHDHHVLWIVLAGVLGVTRNAKALERFVLPWATCAFYRGCISPEETDRSNDRQDQTALNIILYFRRWPTDPIGPPLISQWLPEPDVNRYSLESSSGLGMPLVHANPTKPYKNTVLFSRKRSPPYLYTKFAIDNNE